MNEEVKQNAQEIEHLFRQVYWSTEYNGHDVIGRWVPPADHTTHYGIVAVESVVWDWQDRRLQEKDSANFQIFRVRENEQLAIWTRREVSPSRTIELLDRYGIPMHEANRTRKLVPEEEEVARTIDLRNRLSECAQPRRDLMASGWRVEGMQVMPNESADVIRAHADFVKDVETDTLELRLALHDDFWVHTFEWLDEPHGVSVTTRHETPVGKVLEPEQAALIHAEKAESALGTVDKVRGNKQ